MAFVPERKNLDMQSQQPLYYFFNEFFFHLINSHAQEIRDRHDRLKELATIFRNKLEEEVRDGVPYLFRQRNVIDDCLHDPTCQHSIMKMTRVAVNIKFMDMIAGHEMTSVFPRLPSIRGQIATFSYILPQKIIFIRLIYTLSEYDV